MKIDLTGFVGVSADVWTVAELYEFVQLLQDKNIDPMSEVDWSPGRVFVDLKVHDVDWIECGDHRPVKRSDGAWQEWNDVIFVTHEHDESDSE